MTHGFQISRKMAALGDLRTVNRQDGGQSHQQQFFTKTFMSKQFGHDYPSGFTQQARSMLGDVTWLNTKHKYISSFSIPDTIAFHAVMTSYDTIFAGSPVIFNEIQLNEGNGWENILLDLFKMSNSARSGSSDWPKGRLPLFPIEVLNWKFILFP